jgi:hypothetical protein
MSFTSTPKSLRKVLGESLLAARAPVEGVLLDASVVRLRSIAAAGELDVRLGGGPDHLLRGGLLLQDRREVPDRAHVLEPGDLLHPRVARVPELALPHFALRIGPGKEQRLLAALRVEQEGRVLGLDAVRYQNVLSWRNGA